MIVVKWGAVGCLRAGGRVRGEGRGRGHCYFVLSSEFSTCGMLGGDEE